jgi:hypothetical protein
MSWADIHQPLALFRISHLMRRFGRASCFL